MGFSGYGLTVRQQPVAARACGTADRPDRRPVDPIIILQLQHRGLTELCADGDTASFFCVATLVDLSNVLQQSADAKGEVPAPKSSALLTGTTLASVFYLQDPSASVGTEAFFVFANLNIRTEGSYRMRLDVFGRSGMTICPVAHCITDTFTVYSAKRFPGMTNSTALSKMFSDQGLKIRIRKDIRCRKKANVDTLISKLLNPVAAAQQVPRLQDSCVSKSAGGRSIPRHREALLQHHFHPYPKECEVDRQKSVRSVYPAPPPPRDWSPVQPNLTAKEINDRLVIMSRTGNRQQNYLQLTHGRLQHLSAGNPGSAESNAQQIQGWKAEAPRGNWMPPDMRKSANRSIVSMHASDDPSLARSEAHTGGTSAPRSWEVPQGRRLPSFRDSFPAYQRPTTET